MLIYLLNITKCENIMYLGQNYDGSFLGRKKCED